MAELAGRTGVSLTRPRPSTARVHNEYVDTPLRRLHELHPAALHSVCRTPPPPPPDNNNKKLTGKAVTTQPVAGPECSIICADCGKCRCVACRSPRTPPAAWLCSDLCYCSLDSAVDYASCLCCVKGALYHCWDAQAESADDPCGCGPPRPLARWGCLALAALPLPCLLCYWPFRGAASVAGGLYSRCSRRGCSCPHPSLLAP